MSSHDMSIFTFFEMFLLYLLLARYPLATDKLLHDIAVVLYHVEILRNVNFVVSMGNLLSTKLNSSNF